MPKKRVAFRSKNGRVSFLAKAGKGTGTKKRKASRGSISVEYFVGGKPTHFTVVSTVKEAEDIVRFLARRGMTGWARDSSGKFLPIVGAKRWVSAMGSKG